MNWGYLDVHVGAGLVFVRVLGHGLWLGSYRDHPPLFSERNGHGPRPLRLGGWRLKILRPERRIHVPCPF